MVLIVKMKHGDVDVLLMLVMIRFVFLDISIHYDMGSDGQSLRQEKMKMIDGEERKDENLIISNSLHVLLCSFL